MSSTTRGAGAATMVIGLIAAAALGIAAGFYWHDSIGHAVGSSHGTPAAQTAPGQTPAARQLWTCSMHPQVIREEPGLCPICHMQLVPVRAAGNAPGAGGGADGLVTIDPAAVQNMGVRIAIVERGSLRTRVEAFGALEEREQDHTDINLRVGGWIERLYAGYDGMFVKQGDPLFELYSPDLTQAIEELIAAGMAAAGSGGDAAARDAAGSLRASARARVLRLGLTPEQAEQLGALNAAPPTVTFVSPKSGHVTDKMDLYNGSAVQAGARVLRIADPSILWLNARVFESDLASVRVGQHAEATVDAFPGEVFAGEVSFIHPLLDAGTRTALVRIDLPNGDQRLREGMYASVRIRSEAAASAVLAPREAVIDTGERQLVFIELGQGKFEPREVRLGAAGDGGVVQVLSGLEAGDRVVVSGQFLLDSESRLREAVRKYMDQEKPDGQAAPHSGGRAPAPVETPRPPAASGALAARIDEVYAAYMPLAAALGAEQKDEKALDPAALIAAATAMLGAAEASDDRVLASVIRDAARGLSERSIADQRTAFRVLGEAMLRLVEAHPPSPRAAAKVWVMRCPMAPGIWLQTNDTIANPFYAHEMKACGEILREIGTGAVGAPGPGPGAPR